MEITKDMLIGDIIRSNPDSVEVLFRNGLSCIGCPASQMESLEEACMVHGMDADQVLKRVNDYLANKDK